MGYTNKISKLKRQSGHSIKTIKAAIRLFGLGLIASSSSGSADLVKTVLPVVENACGTLVAPASFTSVWARYVDYATLEDGTLPPDPDCIHTYRYDVANRTLVTSNTIAGIVPQSQAITSYDGEYALLIGVREGSTKSGVFRINNLSGEVDEISKGLENAANNVSFGDLNYNSPGRARFTSSFNDDGSDVPTVIDHYWDEEISDTVIHSTPRTDDSVLNSEYEVRDTNKRLRLYQSPNANDSTFLAVENLQLGSIQQINTVIDGEQIHVHRVVAITNDNVSIWIGYKDTPVERVYHIYRTTYGYRTTVVPNSRNASQPVIVNSRFEHIAFLQSATEVEPSADPALASVKGVALYMREGSRTIMLDNNVCEKATISNPFSDQALQCAASILSVSADGQTVLVNQDRPNGSARNTVFILKRNGIPDLGPYTDVPSDFVAYDAIARLNLLGIGGQCQQTPRKFCPHNTVRRDVAAQWLVKALRGGAYDPPKGTGRRFVDVPADWWAVDWVELITYYRIDMGFGNMFKPAQPLTRAKFAALLARTKYGTAHQPSPVTGIFEDVPQNLWANQYIEELYRDGFISGL